ncbi:Diaminopimelate epimerase-like protein [Auricularia subglabra TFB-10046 SS5]|nr:Diaminopimelate epimerase-like protein [Auricularia subglabra TFB-10046 SS5]
MPAFKYRILDAFTRTQFAGNSAGVFVLASALPTRTLQLIAREINVSETSFILPADEENTFELRWFTPAVEVALCGHATLAAARVLDLPRAVFRTLSGELVAVRTGDGTFELEFPACEKLVAASQEVHLRVTEAVKNALKLDTAPKIKYIGTGVGEAFRYSVLVHMNDGFDLGGQPVNPDAFSILAASDDLRRIILTNRAPAGSGKDIRSRVFAPTRGIPEDPVTGSAHCMLAPYWVELLGKGDTLRALQVSLRGGELDAEWVRDAGRVKLRGAVVETMQGEMYVPNDLVGE